MLITGAVPEGAEATIVARDGTRIPCIRLRPRAPESMAGALQMFSRNERRCRSLDSTYNCMGLVFASRRAAIEPEHFDLVVKADSYRRLEAGELAMPGDVLAYRAPAGAIEHVAIMLEPSPAAAGGFKVMSQWGKDGEWLHDADDLPSGLQGLNIEVWTDRPKRFPTLLPP